MQDASCQNVNSNFGLTKEDLIWKVIFFDMSANKNWSKFEWWPIINQYFEICTDFYALTLQKDVFQHDSSLVKVFRYLPVFQKVKWFNLRYCHGVRQHMKNCTSCASYLLMRKSINTDSFDVLRESNQLLALEHLTPHLSSMC